MAIFFYLAAALGMGMLVSFQPLINAVLARAVGSPYGAAAVSLVVAGLGGIVIAAVAGRGDMSRAALAGVPWWVFLAGLIGSLFVAGGVVIAPVTGAQLFFATVVAGQLLGATLADHFGLFGLAVRPLSLERAAGLALVLGGAMLVRRG
ncbi:DMT family transporter [Amaricoccus sp.]|uniref:DMT family transporter n=1 Tax=Amaricoccus sp. TaxID=1872485 RepID=UPI001B7AFDAE|nr:DMT family transporter [Amaricoccus sp.]MBP7000115.1 DMT family transporter [Amaricoccus sp.]